MIYHYANGQFVLENDFSVNPRDLGFIRGYGVFDYAQIYQGKPFHLFDHLKRLKWSAEQIDLPLPMDLAEMEALAYGLIKKNPPIDAGIRFMLTGGLSGKDYLLPEGNSTFAMLFHPFKPLPKRYYSEGMQVITTLCTRSLPCVKTTHYMPAVLAMKKAARASVDDAIYLNENQELLEATTSNLFLYKEGKWVTAPEGEIVNGVTRSILIQVAKNHYPIEYRALHIDEIEECEEAFLCSSIKDAIPVVKIDSKVIGKGCPGSHTLKIRHLYHNYLNHYLSKSQEVIPASSLGGIYDTNHRL